MVKYSLQSTSEGLCLVDLEGRHLKIDFDNNLKDYRKVKRGLSQEPLSRALGGGKKGLKVLDVSAGLGIDAVFLVQLGYEVTALERHPLLYELLKEAHARWKSPDKVRLLFQHAEAVDFVKHSSKDYDVCYFDPMFPQKTKSALPKQEMVIFKDLVGSDTDAAEVLSTLVNCKKFKRCVVKRPLKAAPLLIPSGCIKGKIIRYDIYGA